MRRSLNWFTSNPIGSPEAAEPSAVGTSGSGPGNNNCYRASPSAQDRRSPSANSPPSSLHHSSRSPSLTPQPATPSSPIFGRSNLSKLVASQPIDLAAPDWDSASASPTARNHSALITEDDFDLFADPDPKRGRYHPSLPGIALDDVDVDVEMTTGPNFDSAMGRSRQDSFVSAGAKPISMANPNRESVAPISPSSWHHSRLI
jgi:transcription factor SFP1